MTRIQEIINFTDKAQVGSTCHRMHVYAKEIRDELSEVHAIKAQRDELLAALKLAADIPREYETEYDGRTYEYCAACGVALSERVPHAGNCAWKVIDAAIARATEGR